MTSFIDHKKHRLGKILTLLAGTLFFMVFALYNGFPVVMHGDTSTYLESAFDGKVPAERPIFYGLFIRLTSLGASIWATIFVQCLLLSYLCTRFIRSLLPAISTLHLMALLLLIALCTIASWYAGQIMPDTFTPILFLAAYLYLTQKNALWETVLLLTIIFISVLVHNSHYVIITLFAFLVLCGSWISATYFRPYRVKGLYLSGVAILSWICLLGSNKIAGNGFVTARASHVFLMGKLAESGVLKTYLEKACPIKDYKICAYKDNIPPVAWEFVWNIEKSPVFKAGGWDSTREEYSTIIRDIASRPKYWPFLAYKSMEATARQVILLNIDEAEELPWRKFDRESHMYTTIARHFPHEINEFEVSRQNLKTLNIPFYDGVFVIVFLLSSLICMFCLAGEDKKLAIPVYILVILFIFINAFTTATFGNVLSRLNSRTIWLLPMVNFIFIYRFVMQKIAGAGRFTGNENAG